MSTLRLMKMEGKVDMIVSKEETIDIITPILDKYFTDSDLKQMGFNERLIKEICFRTDGTEIEDYESRNDMVMHIQDMAQACVDYLLWKGLRKLQNEMDDGEIWAYM